MRRVVVVDDEPTYVNDLRARLPTLVRSPVDVVAFAKPAHLAGHEDIADLSSAVIDLSFGINDRSEDGVELETGVDAIVTLAERAPGCRVVVYTRYDGEPLMRDMVVTIRQTWPRIPFLHKGAPDAAEEIAGFVDGKETADNGIFFEALVDVGPVPPERIAVALARSTYAKPGRAVLLALANRTSPPSARDVGDEVGYRDHKVRKVLLECGFHLQSEGLVDPADRLGLETFWPWCRARRPLLERVLREP